MAAGYSPIFRTPTGLLGLNPQQKRTRAIGDTLTALGIGLMGQGPTTTPQSPLQGFSLGLQGANQLADQRAQQDSQAQRDAIQAQQFGMQQQQFDLEQQMARAKGEALEKAIANLPQDQQDAARADPDTFWKAYSDHLFSKKDTTPKLQTFRRGNQDVTGYFDDSGKFVEMSSGAAFAPQRDNPNFGNTPIYVKDPKGNVHLFRFDPNGGAIEAQLPPGYTVAPQTDFIQTPTGVVPGDKRTGEAVPGAPIIAKDVAGAASQTAQGTAQGQAAANLPSDVQTAQTAMDQVNELLADANQAGRQEATGLSSWFDPRNFIAGQPGYDFKVKVKQLSGGVFLTAYKTLRGSGAITEIEGQQAKEAIARLDTAQSEEEFVKALNDYYGIIQKGLRTAQQRATAAPVLPGGGQTAPAPSSDDPLGLR